VKTCPNCSRPLFVDGGDINDPGVCFYARNPAHEPYELDCLRVAVVRLKAAALRDGIRAQFVAAVLASGEMPSAAVRRADEAVKIYEGKGS
jgi:hypothetical protein